MKLMTVLVLSSVCFSLYAKDMRAGGPVTQVLACKPIKAPKNLSVKLELIRAAVAPQYNIKGATLVKSKFDPANGNPQTKSVLTQKDQTAYNATFVAKDTVVEIDKSPLEAKVNLGLAEYICK